MRTLRIAILGASPCDRCYAACCKRSGAEFSVLLQGPDEERRFAPWAVSVTVAQADGSTVQERVLPYRDDGRCVFLGDDDLCTIYDVRPRSCRQFECVAHYNRHGAGRHGLFLDRNPRVAEMLAALVPSPGTPGDG